MVFRKYKPAKQWGKVDTLIFKKILAARNERKMPGFNVPEAVKATGATVYDTTGKTFEFPSHVKNDFVTDHPAFRQPTEKDHLLYKENKCHLFEGAEPFSDGVDHACALTNAVKKMAFPESLSSELKKINFPSDMEQRITDSIMHGERYDPTLEKLPKRHDPVLFWVRHARVYGAPVQVKNNIVLDNIYRQVLLLAIRNGHLSDIRCDRDEPLSAIVTHGRFAERPLVVRSQPHLNIQADVALKPWLSADEVKTLKSCDVPNIAPIGKLIDLSKSHIYNDQAIFPRMFRNDLAIDMIMWAREQDQKYPWTTEQNAANAVVTCFGAALAQASRQASSDDGTLAKPVLTKGVQLVDGRLDLVAFQLNTLDLSESSSVKNIAWVEKSLPFYKPVPFYENMEEVKNLNMDTFYKFASLMLRLLVMASELLLHSHKLFFKRNLTMFSNHHQSLDSNRITLLFFTLGGLDILDALESTITPKQRQAMIDWIYSLQLDSNSGCDPHAFGFRGSLTSSTVTGTSWCKYDCANLAQTYSALSCLLILGDDLSRLDTQAILEGVRLSQLEDGSFYGRGIESENDMRFVYCAVVICKILNGFSNINVEGICSYIRRSVSYDGGIAQGPTLESHGGSTYCAIASLALLGRLWDESVLSKTDIERLKKWCLSKQDEGFHGRAHKPDDSCYGFWIGATLKILGCFSFVDQDRLRTFLLRCQNTQVGGFEKSPDSIPDNLHSYFSLAALSLMHEPTLKPVNPAMNMPVKAADQLTKLLY
uniref:Geranylgeranyl transferase type-1 subunit beta n=1 Tax=Steinernema glaseri TaxID=37863 RepID=A0A1I8ACE9_9BILA